MIARDDSHVTMIPAKALAKQIPQMTGITLRAERRRDRQASRRLRSSGRADTTIHTSNSCANTPIVRGNRRVSPTSATRPAGRPGPTVISVSVHAIIAARAYAIVILMYATSPGR